ncbi:uncharacterized protein LOC135367136 [Ornithodoros turicata]|uniref:uncharacterized protein LOC135367136 n=1 Tax=Ornithodoros turicata TaxID=34597 RepID=UPI003139E104
MGLHNCLQKERLKMLKHAILLLVLFAVSSTAYVVTGSIAEEGDVNAGATPVENMGEQAQRVGIVLQDVAKRLRIVVKTKDNELITDDDDTEYFVKDILANVTKIVGKVVDAATGAVGAVRSTGRKVVNEAASTAANVVTNILAKVSGIYALDERSITVQDVLTRLCDDIEDAANTIFQSGVLLYGGEVPEEES